jgi:hypothetical protein
VTQLSAILLLALVWVIYRQRARWPLDVVGLFCASMVLFYGFRAVVVAFGLDSFSPDYLFGPTSASVATKVNLIICLFLGGVIVGLALSSRAGLRFPRWLFPTVARQPTGSRYLSLTVALTVAAAVITLVLFAQYGGFTGLLRASKYEKELGGINFLRIAPSMGAIVAVASTLDAVRLRRRRFTAPQRHRLIISVACALLNGYFVFAWGARSMLAIVIFCLAAGLLAFSGQAGGVRTTSRGRVWGGIVLAVIVAIMAVIGLRFARDNAVTGELASELRDETVIRQVSIASNSTMYDAVVLAVRDWPKLYPFRGAGDFVTGAQTAIPRFLVPDRVESVSVGAWFRQVYEPDTVNGWPVGTVGQWYLGFGLPGIMLGGVVSGLVLGMAATALRTSRTNPLAFAAGAAVALHVIQLGVNVETILWWTRWVIPLVLVTYYLRATPRRSRGGTPEPTSPEGPATQDADRRLTSASS